MISVDLAIGLKQTHTEVRTFSKVNFLGPEEDMMVLHIDTSHCIYFAALKGVS